MFILVPTNFSHQLNGGHLYIFSKGGLPETLLLTHDENETLSEGKEK